MLCCGMKPNLVSSLIQQTALARIPSSVLILVGSSWLPTELVLRKLAGGDIRRYSDLNSSLLSFMEDKGAPHCSNTAVINYKYLVYS